jgi:peptidyl-prolyl cis-trans isomerase SurA
MFKVKRIGVMIIVCVFLLSGRSNANVLLDRVVAVVNQEVITWSELYKTMEAEASPGLKELQGDEREEYSSK